MFDCVMPTRNGRHGVAFTWDGRLNLRNACHAEDSAPLDPLSACPAARDYSRAYLHHLVKSGEYLGSMLLSWANTAFYQELMAAMRAAIAEGRFAVLGGGDETAHDEWRARTRSDRRASLARASGARGAGDRCPSR